MHSAGTSELVGAYFHPIARQIDDELIRLEIWASDIGLDDPAAADVGIDGGVFAHVASLFDIINSSLNEIVEDMKSMQATQEQTVRDLTRGSETSSRFDEESSRIESGIKLITLTVRDLVDITNAYHYEQATKLQSGPLAEVRKHVMSTREKYLQPRPNNQFLPPSRESYIAQEDLGQGFKSSIVRRLYEEEKPPIPEFEPPTSTTSGHVNREQRSSTLLLRKASSLDLAQKSTQRIPEDGYA
ncbi:hypothetical protein P7C71_g3589, partial [Lecanoromycetidae sp. Uapishka_2]